MSELAKALATSQAAFPVIERSKTVEVKTKTGGKYTFTYAPLDEILNLVRPILTANGLALSQLLAETENGRPALRTVLLHADGERLEDICPLPMAVNGAMGPQEFGSLVSYIRRYAVVAILGIATEDEREEETGPGLPSEDVPSETQVKSRNGQAKRSGEVETLTSELEELVMQLGATDSLPAIYAKADAGEKEWLERQIVVAKTHLAEKS